MVDVSKLKGKIVERDTTQEELANKIGIDKSTFYRKMKQNGNFSIKEVLIIVTIVNVVCALINLFCFIKDRME